MTPKLEKSVNSVGSDPSVMGNGETKNIALKMSTTILFDLEFKEFANETVTRSYAKQKNYFNSNFIPTVSEEMNVSHLKSQDLAWLLLPCVSNLFTRRILSSVDTLIWFYSTLCNYGWNIRDNYSKALKGQW